MLSFALAIFTGAFLLFQVQPLIGKFVLPWFGGSPAVWTTCMLFFQIVLLGGYAYAHWLSTCLKPRRQAQVHGALLLASLPLLPIIPADSWKPDPAADPTTHILLLLLATIGLPYFVVSTTGPLMQKWFSWLNPGRSPYRLYALSNIGSLLALVSYPFLVEPLWTRKQQAWAWSGGLVLFVVFCGWCAWRLWSWERAGGMPDQEKSTSEAAPEKPPAGHKFLWVALPACASALLLATTNKVCQDVAVIPFLWVAPLCLYLLTFILCFDERKWYWRRVFIPLLVVGIMGVCWVLDNVNDVPMMRQIGIFFGMLFACCMVCHGEVYKLRPHTRYLTAFYLLISLGGALGGLFVAVGAPAWFTTYVELHWVMAACGLLAWLACKPSVRAVGYEKWHTALWVTAALTVAALGFKVYRNAVNEDADEEVVAATRNFYGALAVLNYDDDDADTSQYYLLRHGRITHGFQILDESFRGYATTYYGPNSGVGLAIAHTPRDKDRRIAVVGLGTGTLAACGQPGDVIRIYEINPEVRRLAETHFSFLKDSKAKVEVVMGDARLNFEREQPQNYDVIALDAFSSDAIPVHLLTREAFDLYRRHLRPGGVIVVHISNRYLDLEPIVRHAAGHLGYGMVVVEDDNELDQWWVYESTWVLLSEHQEFLKAIELARVTKPDPSGITNVPPWTDDYSSLFGILNR